MNERIRRALRLLTLAILSAGLLWSAGMFGLAWLYVDRLLNPPCLRAVTGAPDGFEDLELHRADASPLKGWWRPPENGTVVVILGGHGENRDSWLPVARMLADHGYGVLTLDYRQCVGQPVSLGVNEIEELRLGVRFAHSHKDVERLVALGFSAGGVAVIRGSTQLPEVDAVVSLGNYPNLAEEIARSPEYPPMALGWQLQQMVTLILRMRLGVWPQEISPIDSLPSLSPRPVFLIYGEGEVAHLRGYDQFSAAREPRRLWVVPATEHGGYYQADPDEFERQVLDFLSTID